MFYISVRYGPDEVMLAALCGLCSGDACLYDTLW